MKIVIPGGAGQVGTILARALTEMRHEVVVLSRTPRPESWRTVAWDARTLGAWKEELEDADAVINLAGRNVNCRYNEENHRQIMESRVLSAHAVGRAIAACVRPPRVWLQMATATIYSHHSQMPHDETSGILGGNEADLPPAWRFSLEVAGAWERAAAQAQTPRTRKVILRTTMVMSPDPGGVFAVFVRLVRLGLGGHHGDGRQYVSWIHDADLVRAVLWLIDRGEMVGPVIVGAPNPLPDAEFMRALRSAWGMRLGLPQPRWMLSLGAVLMGTETELILKSRRVVPGRLMQSGFEFQFPTWPQAAENLCRRWRDRKFVKANG